MCDARFSLTETVIVFCMTPFYLILIAVDNIVMYNIAVDTIVMYNVAVDNIVMYPHSVPISDASCKSIIQTCLCKRFKDRVVKGENIHKCLSTRKVQHIYLQKQHGR